MPIHDFLKELAERKNCRTNNESKILGAPGTSLFERDAAVQKEEKLTYWEKVSAGWWKRVKPFAFLLGQVTAFLSNTTPGA